MLVLFFRGRNPQLQLFLRGEHVGKIQDNLCCFPIHFSLSENLSLYLMFYSLQDVKVVAEILIEGVANGQKQNNAKRTKSGCGRTAAELVGVSIHLLIHSLIHGRKNWVRILLVVWPEIPRCFQNS